MPLQQADHAAAHEMARPVLVQQMAPTFRARVPRRVKQKHAQGNTALRSLPPLRSRQSILHHQKRPALPSSWALRLAFLLLSTPRMKTSQQQSTEATSAMTKTNKSKLWKKRPFVEFPIGSARKKKVVMAGTHHTDSAFWDHSRADRRRGFT
eukprot:6173092-Pleurochrysis_carterae.AAC.1